MKVLMCPPTEFQVSFEINPWMNIEKQPSKQKAWQQWHKLFEIYQGLGIKISLIKPEKGLPDMVFVANAGLPINKKFILSNFRYKERREETIYYKKWFESQKFEIITLPKNVYFEGQAEIVELSDAFIFGFDKRGSESAIIFLKKYLGGKKPIIPLKLVDDRFYHLDLCLMYIEAINTIIYFPGAFDEKSQKIIEKLNVYKIKISENEAKKFLCNGLSYKNSVILSGKNTRIITLLKNKGLEVINLDISEFKKSGGGVKCVSLLID